MRHPGAATVAMVAIVAFACPAIAQQGIQLWPEAEVYWSSSPRYRLFAMLEARADFDEHTTLQTAGMHVDRMLRGHAFARVGYWYRWTPADRSDREQRVLAEGTLQPRFGRMRLVTRTRAEMRWLSDGRSMRARQNVKLERPVRWGGERALIPYISDELFYDSRYGALARNRFRPGVKVQMTRQTSVDVSWIAQRDKRPSSHRLEAVGVAAAWIIKGP